MNSTSDTEIYASSSTMNSFTSDTEIYASSTSVNSLTSDTEIYMNNSSNSSNTNDSFSIENHEGLKCLYTNADSIGNKWTELESLVYIHQPDIVGLTEAFPKTGDRVDISCFVLEGFQQFVNPRFCDIGNRGTILFIRNGIEGEIYPRMNNISSKESCWCEVKTNNDKILIGLVYRSPNSDQENNLQLNRLMSEIGQEKHCKKIIMGDFNYKDINWEHWTSEAPETCNSHEFIEAARDSFLYQHVNFYTRFRNSQQPSVLDLVFSTDKLLINNLQHYSPIGKSDHVVITFNIDCDSRIDAEDKEFFLYDKGDYEAITLELSSLNWEREFSGQTLNDRWVHLKNKIHTCMDKFIPKKKVKSRTSKKNRPIWMTKKALKAIRKKHRSWQKYMKTREHIHFQYYCRDRNAATRECRTAQSDFEHKISEENNPKAFFKYANSKRKVNVGIAKLKKSDNSFAEDDSDKSEVLNKFFKSVFVEEDVENVPDTNDRSDGQKIEELNIDEEQVLKILETLNPVKSSGPDLLHPRVLKEIRNTIVTPLTLIFKQSYAEGEVAEDWKTAHVKALFKKGSREEAANYRPISLTCIPCKMMEKIVRDHIVNYMTTNRMFSDSQYGFRSLRSCALQLLEVMETWTEWLDDGKSFDCVYYDFRKAFDTVPHARLIKKLQSYGIDGEILDWIKTFLHQRKQRVVVNKDMSKWSDVTSGVPQGSVLGPTLFLIYINDIEDMIESTIRLFADDTKLFNITETPSDNEQIQRDTDRLSKWSDTWLLKFNTDKCSTLHYGRHNPDNTYSLGEGSDRKDIPNNTQECDLGIVFSPDLKFRQNINKCINKANGRIGLVRRTFSHITTKQFRKLYKTLIRPQVEYGNLIWHPRFIKDIQSIERVQKRATKLVRYVRHLPYPDRLKILKIPTLAYRRFRGDMIEVYKLLHGKEDIEYTTFFDLNPNTTRGHPLKLKKKAYKRDIRKHFFSQRVVTPWNDLPEDVVTAPTLNTFKNRLDTFMDGKCYTVIPDRTWVIDQEGAIRG